MEGNIRVVGKLCFGFSSHSFCSIQALLSQRAEFHSVLETTLQKPVAPQQHGNNMGLAIRGPEFKLHLYSVVDLWRSLLALMLLSSLIIKRRKVDQAVSVSPSHAIILGVTQDYRQSIPE